MSSNIEIKAKYLDLKIADQLAKKIATDFIGADEQIDTYFQTKNGRFKLRESKIDGNYLIPYLRPNTQTSKRSDYAKIPVNDSENVKSLFRDILGLHCIVKKHRKIYLYENVRIHLDEVDLLGTFIEFEAVFDGRKVSEKIQKKKIDYLLNYFSIVDKDLIAISYQDLICKKWGTDKG